MESSHVSEDVSDSNESTSASQKRGAGRQPGEKSPEGKDKSLIHFIGFGGEGVGAFANSVGVKTMVGDRTGIVNCHEYSAFGRRAAAVLLVQQLKGLGIRRLVLMYPRKSEKEFWSQYTGIDIKELRKKFFGDDIAAFRVKINTDKTQIKQTIYLFCDCAYHYGIRSLFVDHSFWEHPDFAGGGAVRCKLILMHFGGKGECLFMLRFKGDKTPDRVKLVHYEDKEGVDRVREEKTLGHPAFDKLEAVGYRASDGDELKYVHGCDPVYGHEGSMQHVTHSDEFFRYAVYTFLAPVGGGMKEVTAEIHIEGRVGYHYILSVAYRLARPDDRNLRAVTVSSAFVHDGRVPGIENSMIGRAKTVDVTSSESMLSFQREFNAEKQRMLSKTDTSSLARIYAREDVTLADIVAKAFKRSEKFLLYGGDEVVYRPLTSTAQANEAKARKFEGKYGVSTRTAEVLTELTADQTKVEFYLTLLKIGWDSACRVLQTLQDFIFGVLGKVMHMSQIGGLAPLCCSVLDSVKTLQSWWPARLKVTANGFTALYHYMGRVKNAFLGRMPRTRQQWADHFLQRWLIIWNMTSAAVFEELLRYRYPTAAAMYFAFEVLAKIAGAVESKDWTDVVVFSIGAVASVVFHTAMFRYSLPYAMALHLTWNILMCTFAPELVDAFKSAFLEDFTLKRLPPVDNIATEYPDSQLLCLINDRWEPVTQNYDVMSELRAELLESKKYIAMEGDLVSLFRQPVSTAAGALSMVLNRLEGPVASQPDYRVIRESYEIVRAYLLPAVVATPLTCDQLLEYLRNHDYSKTRILEYREWARLLRLACDENPRLLSMYVKTDEKLPATQKLLEFMNRDFNFMHLTGDEAASAKGRPIVPIGPCDLPLFCFLIPFKRRFEEPMVWVHHGVTVSLTYLLENKDKCLGKWLTKWIRVNGIHSNMLGDDNYLLHVSNQDVFFTAPDGRVLDVSGFSINDAIVACIAFDMQTCDRTTNQCVQERLSAYMEESGLDSTVAVKFLESTNLNFRLDVSGKLSALPFKFKRKEAGTNTGGPATSIQAAFHNFLPTGAAAIRCVTAGDWSRETFLSVYKARLRSHGIIAVFETGLTGEWGTVSSRSYLASVFMPASKGEVEWVHVLLSQAKMLTIVPDVWRLYGGGHPVERHMLAISQDGSLRNNAFGVAISTELRRIAAVGGEDNLELAWKEYSKTLTPFMRELQNTLHQDDSYVDMDQFFACMRSFCEDRSLPTISVMADMTDLLAILRRADVFPIVLDEVGVVSQYLPRFEQPKLLAQRFVDFSAFVQGEDLQVSALTYSAHMAGIRIYNYIRSGNYYFMHGSGSANGRKAAGQSGGAKSAKQQKAVGRLLQAAAETKSTKGKKFEISLGKGSYGPLSIADFKLKTGGNARSRNAAGGGQPPASKIVPRREYLGEVDGAAGYACSQLRMQPGDPGLFPWLSKDAALYERYKIRKFRFEFVPNVTDTVDGGQRGTVSLSFDYDPASPAPTDIGEAMESDPHVAGLPTLQHTLHLNSKLCTPLDVGKFVRTTSALPGQAADKFDFGVLNICVAGTTVGFPLGKIFVDYEIEFFSAQLVPVGFNVAALIASFKAAVTQTMTASTNTMELKLFGVQDINNLGIELSTDKYMYLRRGTYRITGFLQYYQTSGYVNMKGRMVLNEDKITSYDSTVCVAHQIGAAGWSVLSDLYLNFDEFLVINGNGLWGADEDATRVSFTVDNNSVTVATIALPSVIRVELLSASPQ